MHICRTATMAVVALTVVVAAGTLPASSNGSASGQSPLLSQPDSPHGGIVIGTAWKADNAPFGHALIRLRDIADGRAAGLARANERGEFRFGQVPAGRYVVELISAGEAVVAVGEPFVVVDGETVSTFVRLTSRAPWFSGFFGNAAAAAIATASSLGITAIGSSGRPASPQ
jgi:hypothetical protein